MFVVCERLVSVVYSCCIAFHRVGTKRDLVASIQYRRIHRDVNVTFLLMSMRVNP